MISKTRPSTRVAAALAAAVAAVSVAGCGGPVEAKPWSGSDQRLAEVAATSDAAAAAEAGWVTAPWTGKISMNNSDTRDQFSSTPMPGVVIMQWAEGQPAGGNRCTLGTAVQTDTGPGFLTAGHCDETADAPLWLFPTADVSGVDAVKLPKPYTGAVDSDGKVDPKLNAAVDAALVPLNPGQLGEVSTELAQRYHVAGVLTADAAKRLPKDTPICFDGAVSGLQCGTVSNANSGGKLLMGGDSTEARPFTKHGDSGAPVFVLDRQGRAVLVGLLSKGAEGPIGWVTYLESNLIATGTKALLDPDVIPYSGDDYSKLTATAPLNR
ncbi:hypothetical protein [Mycolicibacterium mageritense]|uniref:hypothetical protein n=1 Tax=Mycolicibacterium mageritense TaxID=53462 RepID=UPI0011D4C635|nr:hypothetical protein [Mycolicibacterium mageritense]TXI59715.1 MAG: hypothetical protein E6Q55_21145 [Mycolicibacterium mageritense]